MRMSAGELLDEIEAAGGSLAVLPDRGLDCHNITPCLRDELVRLQFVIVAILLGECEPRPFQLIDKKKLKKLVKQVRDEGGLFRLTERFFECELPDHLMEHKTTVLNHADTIFEIISPKRPSSRSKRPRCAICPAGKGCRTVGRTLDNQQPCPICNHACRSRFRASAFW